MVVAIAKRGRPYLVPKIDYVNDGQIELCDQFYKICSTFHYREIAGWSRILGVHPFTVERWKYKMTFPGYYIAKQIIDWDGQGRPWEKVFPWQSAVDMF